MVITVIVTELSFRLVETPIRTGAFMKTIRRARRNARPVPRRILLGSIAAAAALSLFAGASLVTADLEQNEIAEEFRDNEESTTDLSSSGASIPASDTTTSTTSTTTSTTTTSTTTTTVPPPTTVARQTPVSAPLPTTVVPAAPGTSPPPTTVAPAPTTTLPVVPNTTVPPTTAPAPPAVTSLGVVTDAAAITPLTVPPQPAAPGIRLVGFGDSVMLGSAERLTAQGFVVDAVQSRQFSKALPELQTIRDNGFLGSAVVVHLGTNGSFPQASLDEMMAILADVPIVVFVTGKADRVWIAGNNEKIRALPAAYPNVTVLDWEAIGPQCPGDCFYDDQIHLNGSGQTYYADLIGKLLGL